MPNTRLLAPTATGATLNQWTSPGQAIDGINLLTASETVNGEQQDFHTFNWASHIPATATIVGLELVLRAWNNSGVGTTSLGAELSWNAGSSYTTSAKTTGTLTTSSTTTDYTLGGAADTWGRSWTYAELSNANFRLRLTSTIAGGSTNVDYIQMRVYFTYTPTNTSTSVNDYRVQLTIPCTANTGYIASGVDPTGSGGTEMFSTGFVYDGIVATVWPGSSLSVGQIWNAPASNLMYLEFDTSAIPEGARIHSAKLLMNGGGAIAASTNWELTVRAYDYGTSLTTADWVRPTPMDALPEVAGIRTEDIISVDCDFYSTENMVPNIDTAGYTRFVMHNSYFGGQPLTGGSSINDNMTFTGYVDPTTAPRLVVEYDVPPAYTEGVSRDKRYIAKLYDEDRTLIRVLPEIKELPPVIIEGNSLGGQLALEIGIKYTDLDEDQFDTDHIVTIEMFDYNHPSGIQIFDGSIMDIKGRLRRGETWAVLQLNSLGEDLTRYMFEQIETTASQTTGTPDQFSAVDTITGTGEWLASVIAPEFGQPLIKLRLYNIGNVPAVSLWTGVSKPTTQFDRVLNADFEYVGYSNAGGYYYYDVPLTTPYDATVGQNLWLAIEGVSSSTTVPVSGSGTRLTSSDSGVTWASASGAVLYTAYYGTYATTISYTDTEISYMVVDIMRSYNRQGGTISFDGGTVNLTGHAETYEFKDATCGQALLDVVRLAPPGWMLVIDFADRKAYWQKSRMLPDYKIKVGTNLNELDASVSNKDVANVAYFSGGETAGTNLYVKTVNEASRTKHGTRAVGISDNRVTTTATAQAINSNALRARGNYKVPRTYNVIDVPISGPAGYVIEYLRPGYMAALTNIGTYGVQRLDHMFLDSIWLDYKKFDLSTFVLQIQRVELYKYNALIYLDYVPFDERKLLSDINYRLTKQETVNNPATPETAVIE